MFQQEVMICTQCGCKQEADPRIESGWYSFLAEKSLKKYYCPPCLGNFKTPRCLQCDHYYHEDYLSCPWCAITQGQPIPQQSKASKHLGRKKDFRSL